MKKIFKTLCVVATAVIALLSVYLTTWLTKTKQFNCRANGESLELAPLIIKEVKPAIEMTLYAYEEYNYKTERNNANVLNQ